MAVSALRRLLLLATAWATTGVWAQRPDTRPERVHAAVVVTLHGDRTPLLLSTPSELTPLGAQQMFAAGTFFRHRYISAAGGDGNGSTAAAAPILGLASHQIPRAQLYVAAPNLEYQSSSAIAFTQGLYPPLNRSSGNAIVDGRSVLANGSTVESPLGGYQYPRIATPSDLDPTSAWLSGDVGCPQHGLASARDDTTAEFRDVDAQSRDFYRGYESSVLSGSTPGLTAGYRNAFDIYDYVRYAKLHNRTVDERVSAADLARFRALATQRERASNRNRTAIGPADGGAIQAVAGRALATQVLGLLTNHVDARGTERKLSVVFGSHRLFMAFFALSRLSDLNPNLGRLPNPGSSMVFELYSRDNATADANRYPDEAALQLRFMFRNGSTHHEPLTRYPIFVRTGSQTDPAWSRFRDQMEQIMFPTPGDWCNVCASPRLFCAFFRDSDADGRSSRDAGSRRVRPVVAGVIGTLVTLAVLALAAAAAFFLGRLRLHRAPPRRQSQLSGIKGREKLASDPDLVAGHASSSSTTTTTEGTSHERVGSWELKNHVPIRGGTPTWDRSPSSMADLVDHHDDPAVHSLARPVPVDDRV